MLTNRVRPSTDSAETITSEVDAMSTRGQHKHAPAVDSMSPSKQIFHSSHVESGKQNIESELFTGRFGSASTLEIKQREAITWRKVAEALDRLLFLGFTLFVLVLTVTMLPYMAIMAG